MCVTEISGEEGLDGAEEIFEDIKAENFEKLITNTKLQIQEFYRTLHRINS